MASEEILKGWSEPFLKSFMKTEQYVTLFTGSPQGAHVESTYQETAMRLVHDYVKAHLDVTDAPPEINVYVVWFTKTLRNWKALLNTTLPDGMYYEVTYDGDKNKAYLDAYKKFDNVEVSFGDDSEADDSAGAAFVSRVHTVQRRINEGG